jgi:hypothetical protein
MPSPSQDALLIGLIIAMDNLGPKEQGDSALMSPAGVNGEVSGELAKPLPGSQLFLPSQALPHLVLYLTLTIQENQ